MSSSSIGGIFVASKARFSFLDATENFSVGPYLEMREFVLYQEVSDRRTAFVGGCGAAHGFCHKGCVSVGPQGGSVIGLLGGKEDVSSGRKGSRASLAKEGQACTWDPDLSLAECRSGARLVKSRWI